MKQKMDQVKVNESLENDYKTLFPNFETFGSLREWEKEGDVIKEFNLYEDYPPAYTSCNTVPINS